MSINSKEYVEFNEDGFVLKYGSLFEKLRRKRLIPWDKVAAIDVSMRDCFLAHIVSLVFYDENDDYLTHISEDVKGYEVFTRCIKEKFSGFNSHNFEAIGLMFPSDISSPCWERGKTIGDLEVKRENNKILWEDSQKIFLEWKDENLENPHSLRVCKQEKQNGKSTCI